MGAGDRRMTIAAVLLAALLAWGLWEGARHRRALERIPLRVLVNGTRGKTSVARLTAAALNEAGIVTCAKTTGSQARHIGPDGTETDYRGHRAASMMEQLAFFRHAAAGGAQAVVVECMAIAAENQRAMARMLVRPTHVLMTNALVDHVEEIGDSVKVTAQTLALSVPAGARVWAGSDDFLDTLPQAVRAAPDGNSAFVHSLGYPAHPANVGLVLAFTQALGIPEETARRGMRSARPDAGMAGPFRLGQCTVHNAFAANDVQSFLQMLGTASEAEAPLVLLYNHRADRAYRLKLFAQAIRSAAAQPAAIGVTGEGAAAAARLFARHAGRACERVRDPVAWAAAHAGTPCQLVCFGNIRGAGMRLVEYLMKEDGRDA